ncbi:hypothetical protein GIB67_003087 [Kingdonia uniflora]|uniref:Uncharacterized protein n=1 Tax=Kingdonia uniflora TaxID=39325 RepID=A0A7J7N5Q8_9MAGN|nr:hypothetical protein GIB67_003087 [Kingdonia uniflora]
MAEGNRRMANDQATNLFILGRYHIVYRTIESITRELWLEFEVSKIGDILTAKLIFYLRMPLQVPNGNYEYYLGDRCWRHLVGEAHIPLDPPLSMSPHISPMTIHEMRQVRFIDCEHFVVGEEREIYSSYWAEQILEDLQLRRGREVRVVPLPPGGGAWTRHRGSGQRTRGGSIGDDSE